MQSKHKDDYGAFKLSAGKYFDDEKRDQGLKTSQDAKFYSRAAKFPKVTSSSSFQWSMLMLMYVVCVSYRNT